MEAKKDLGAVSSSAKCKRKTVLKAKNQNSVSKSKSQEDSNTNENSNIITCDSENKENEPLSTLLNFFGLSDLSKLKEYANHETPNLNASEVELNTSLNTSCNIDHGEVESILASLTENLKSTIESCQTSVIHDIDDEYPDQISFLSTAGFSPAERLDAEVTAINSSYLHHTLDSTMDTTFFAVEGSPEDILTSFQLLIREIFFAFRRSNDCNVFLSTKKMPELMWANHFMTHVRHHQFYTLTNMTSTLFGDQFNLSAITNIMSNHRTKCKGTFNFPKLDSKWSIIKKIAQFVPIVLCTECRASSLSDECSKTLFQLFEMIPTEMPGSLYSRFNAGFKVKENNKNKDAQKDSPESEENNSELENQTKLTYRFRLVLRDIFFDVQRSSDCNSLINNSPGVRNDPWRHTLLRKLRNIHYVTVETWTVHLGDMKFDLRSVPEILKKHESICTGTFALPDEFQKLNIIDKLASFLPSILCMNCNQKNYTQPICNEIENIIITLKRIPNGEVEKGLTLIHRCEIDKKRKNLQTGEEENKRKKL